MAEIRCTDMVLMWHLNNPVRQSGKLSDNPLFRMLYNAFCRRIHIPRSYSDVAREGSYMQACDALFSWYEQRYKEGFGMECGTKGQKRFVSGSDAKYTFDLLYCDDRQFKNYLVTDLPQSGNQDLFSFVLHTAVAFLVPPEELDRVLQQLGFHPLHVKNIHHLAVYYVLLEAQGHIPEPDFNPFRKVRSLYETGKRIMEEPDTSAGEGFDFGTRETRFIRQALFIEKKLRHEKFENLVSVNKAALNTRHSLILRDFHKLTAVFMHIYDMNCDDIDSKYPQTSEEAFSFYAFVESFCKDGLSRRKFREQLTGMIDLHGKHPTRSIMILLWLFAFCFAFTPGIYVSETTFRRITKQLEETSTEWAAQAENHYRKEYFDVFGFLADAPGRSVPHTFRGSEFVEFINGKLWGSYGWGPLNARIPFDYYILKLGEISVCKDQRYSDSLPSRVSWGNERVTGIQPRVDNVPEPLAALAQILTGLKKVIGERNALLGNKDQSPCPLKCSLYEQI